MRRELEVKERCRAGARAGAGARGGYRLKLGVMTELWRLCSRSTSGCGLVTVAVTVTETVTGDGAGEEEAANEWTR